MDLTPKLERKCKLCGKGENSHLADSKACIMGTGSGWIHRTNTFEDSGKFTIKSKREVAKHEERLANAKAREEAEAAEKAKVRAMTFEEVVTATCELLTEITGLGIIVEREYPGSAHIHLTNLGGKIRLGYTSVTQYSNGSFGVGGTSAGCFMSNHSDACIANVIRQPFRDLELKANQEKA
jgi:hypothetical protein